jgi:predicted oxidoreductase
MSTPSISVPRIALGADGPELSRITFGCWRMSGWQQTPQQRLALIEQALELGITSFDHADIYASETPFGEALALAPRLRQRMQLVSKCGIYGVSPAWPSVRVPHYNTTREHIIASAEHSLRRLGTDHLDLLLIHRPDPLMDADEVAEAFGALRGAGKVRHFGVSNFSCAQFELLDARVPLVTNQIEFSPLCLAPLADGTLDQAQRLRRPPMIWSPLAGGRLFDGRDARAAQVAATLTELAQRYGHTPATIAYAWLLRHPSQPVVLTGSRRVEALHEAAAAAAMTLAREDWFAILRAATGADVP